MNKRIKGSLSLCICWWRMLQRTLLLGELMWSRRKPVFISVRKVCKGRIWQLCAEMILSLIHSNAEWVLLVFICKSPLDKLNFNLFCFCLSKSERTFQDSRFYCHCTVACTMKLANQATRIQMKAYAHICVRCT